MRSISIIMLDVHMAREDARAAGTHNEVEAAREVLLRILEEYFDATADDVAPTERLVRVAAPVMLS
jgi:hypothetical protein